MWRYVTQDDVSGSRAAATDAFMLSAYARGGSLPDPTLHIFTYPRNTLLLGRFQSLSEQVNVEECERSRVALARRLTGGGAMLMGEEQIAVSLVTCLDHPATPATKQEMFQAYGNAICRGLRHLRLDCRLGSLRDLVVGAAKIGTADLIIDPSGAILFQAHVLVDFDPQAMARLLHFSAGVSAETAADFLAQRWTTISREKGGRVEPRLVRDFICTGFEVGFGIEFQQFPVTPLESQYLTQIEREKFQHESWLQVRSPTSDMTARSAMQTPGGLLLAYASVSAGKIGRAILAGDFFGDPESVAAFESSVQGAPLEYNAIRLAAERCLPAGAIEAVDFTDVAQVLWSAVSSSTAGPYRAGGSSPVA